MHTADAIVEILKREGVTTLFCFPTTSVIENAVAAGMRPIICRQERVGVDMADGYARVTNGQPPGVFAMQYGPGCGKCLPRHRHDIFRLGAGAVPAARPRPRAGAGVSDVPCQPHLCLGHQAGRAHHRAGAGPGGDAARVQPAEKRTAGPVMVELPRDLLALDIGSETLDHRPVARRVAAPAAHDVEEAAKLLMARGVPGDPRRAGRAVRRGIGGAGEARGTAAGPVMTTVDGKSAFPEDHALSLGSGGNAFTGHGRAFPLYQADLILASAAAEPPSADHAAAAEDVADHPRHQRSRAICTRAIRPKSRCWAMRS